MEVPRGEVKRYGIIDAQALLGEPSLFEVRDMVEKPAVADAPSNLAIIGRYILTPGIFRALRETDRGSGGEIQLTDGLRRLLRKSGFLATNSAESGTTPETNLDSCRPRLKLR